MTDDEFIAIAVKAAQSSEDYNACTDFNKTCHGDDAWGWGLSEIIFTPERGRSFTRIRLFGHDLSVAGSRSYPRGHRCFAHVDRGAKNAAKLLYRLTMAVACSVPQGAVRRSV